MSNKLNLKYHEGMSLEQFQYSNYGFSLTRAQKYTALSQWVWLNKNAK